MGNNGMMAWKHTITIERVTPELKREYGIEAGQTVAIVERTDCGIAKICHTMNRRSPKWRSSAMSMATCYAYNYGAKFEVPASDDL